MTSEGVHWRIPRRCAPAGLRLDVDWVLSQDPAFAADGEWWTYHLPRPAADRLDYRLALGSTLDGSLDAIDPQARGDSCWVRSEVRFPEYAEPSWLATAVRGETRPVPVSGLRLDVPVQLWTPPGLVDDQPAPLLLVHDGTGFAQEGSFLAWASAFADRQPLRVALLDSAPDCRNDWYAANPVYADEVARRIVPRLHRLVAVTATIGLGASLGGLAFLALHRRHPDLLDALALQSGSFFTPDLDPQEARFTHFAAVCAAVAAAVDDPPERRVPVLLTCGTIEENLANNRRLATRLGALGYPLRFVEVRDGHTTTCWRDAWSPHLAELIAQVGSTR